VESARRRPIDKNAGMVTPTTTRAATRTRECDPPEEWSPDCLPDWVVIGPPAVVPARLPTAADCLPWFFF
jgi:hypothetical protein